MTRTPPLSASARGLVARSLDAIEARDRGVALDAANELGAMSGTHARAVAARLLYLLRDYPGALALLEAGDDEYLRRLRYSFLKRLRYEHEAGDVLEELLASGDAKTAQAAVLHFKGIERPDRALSHLETVIAAQPDAAHWYALQAELAADAGDAAAVAAACRRAVDLGHADWTSLADDALRAGRYDVVEELAGRLPEDPVALAYRAQLQLFRGRFGDARVWAEDALSRAGDVELAVCTVVGSLVAEGDLARARERAGAWRGPRNVALRAWVAELDLRQGRLEDARRGLVQLRDEVPDYLAAKLLWVLADPDDERERAIRRDAHEGLLEGQLAALGVELDSTASVPTNELQSAASHGLERLAGNRTPWPSTVDADGTLRRVDVPTSPRHRARRSQHRVLSEGITKAKAVLDEELATLGPHPIAECYRAELDLWEGSYRAAAERFEDILARRRETTWGWIGLGMAQLLGGDPESGLATLDEGVTVIRRRGATLPVARGDALYRLGRFDEALEELSEACETHPSRLAAWVLRGLVLDARGASDELVVMVLSWLEREAPQLLADAAQRIEVPGWWPKPLGVDRARPILESALALMRGNRASSCPFWFAPGGDHVRSYVLGRPPTTAEWERDEISQLRLIAS